ncbi:hypothetical protein PR254_01090 [Metamycoplasma hyosynoviae]|uniref:hypothetical protein n=5 Tax=Metamycoplasma hyosynoviae TaxID=29559 RepID=UPI002358DC04|nr:hypothetical protein [Metamycoplasma hyosynoviae]MDC8927045.1 hypothetical protein [Metamycoplasma hyosynoviae]MDD7896840.1 hypothetical protein [Metamycoplasma hyosynoviae]MDD7912602.1 hypothetical protein [Metamycoplasma hyosynoviae]
MNKTTKIILCAAIPAGAASILIPTIVVASLKSKARKTEQERKLLSDLNLEVQDYLGKITNEVKDNDVQEYQELLELTSRMKNVINNKYLKKEDYKKQLLLLKEKFDSFKEKINPPRKNDTNENTDNTNNANPKDVDSTKDKENSDGNKTNENETKKDTITSAYDQLKNKFKEAEDFYDSIENENIKKEFSKYLNEIKKIINDSTLSQEVYIEAKNTLIKNIEIIKNKISNKIDEVELDPEIKENLNQVITKISLFLNNLKTIENNELYKNDIFNELDNIRKEYNITLEIEKSLEEIKYKEMLLDHINHRYEKLKENIDNKNITKEKLENEIAKLSNMFDTKQEQLSIFVNKEDITKTFKNYSSKIESIANDEVYQIWKELTNIYLIFEFSLKISQLYNKLNSIKSLEQDGPLYPSKNSPEENEILHLINKKFEFLKKIEGWGNNKYLQYFHSFFEIQKSYLKINNFYNELKSLYELAREFNFLQTKLEYIYNNHNQSISNEEKINLNKKIRENIINSLISNQNINTFKKAIDDINNELKLIEESKDDNTITYIENLENRKNAILNILKKYEKLYDVNVVNNAFNEIKKNYKSEPKDSNYYHTITRFDDFFSKYEKISKNIDVEIEKYNNLIKEIETLHNNHKDNSYPSVIEIKSAVEEIKNEKFKKIQDVSLVNFILTSFINTIKAQNNFIKKLPKDINMQRKSLNDLIVKIENKFNKKTNVQGVYTQIISKIKRNIENNNDVTAINNYIFFLTEFEKILSKDFSTIKNKKIYKDLSKFDSTNEYIFKLIDQHSTQQNEIISQIENSINKFNLENIAWLRVANDFFEYLTSLDEEYNKKILECDNAYKNYSKKINTLGDLISKANKQENIIFINKILFIVNLFEFSNKYYENIYYKTTNDMKIMEQKLDKIIEILKNSKI